MNGKINCTSTAAGATVYLNGARVARSARVALAPGKNEAAIGGLSATLNPDSLNVAAKGAELVNLRYAVSALETAENTARTAELVALRDAAREAVAEDENALAALDSRLALLLQNCNCISNEKFGFDELKQIDGYYAKTCEELYARRRKCLVKLDEDKRELARLDAEIGARDAQDEPTGVVTLTLFAQAAVEAELEITYFDGRAGWQPVYDLRVSDPASPLLLNARAKVFQSTGEDWSDIALTLSSAAPREGMTPPELSTWYLRENIARPRAKLMMAAPAGAVMCADAVTAENAAPAPLFREASVTQAQTSVEFALPARVSVPTDDDGVSFDLVSHELEAKYVYFCVPKLQPEVYLLAKVRGWESLNLLAGEASVFLGGSYLGSVYLDPKSDEDELSLSLGCDAAILVTRRRTGDKSAKGFIGATRRASRRWELSVKNTKPSEITLQLLDQIPVSAYEPIKVTADELSGGELDGETGEVRFEIKLRAGETVKKVVGYSVSYPKDIPVVLE